MKRRIEKRSNACQGRPKTRKSPAVPPSRRRTANKRRRGDKKRGEGFSPLPFGRAPHPSAPRPPPAARPTVFPAPFGLRKPGLCRKRAVGNAIHGVSLAFSPQGKPSKERRFLDLKGTSGRMRSKRFCPEGRFLDSLQRSRMYATAGSKRFCPVGQVLATLPGGPIPGNADESF